MKALLQEIDNIIEKNIPNFKKLLNEPATDEEIKHLEETIGEKLPESFISLYKWHNGQQDNPYVAFHPETHEKLMSVDDIIEWYDELNGQLECGDIDDTVWKTTWIPFTDDGMGNSGCVDVSTENFGKVIFQDHEGDEHVFYDSLEEWLTKLIETMKTTNYKEWDYVDRLDSL